MRLLALQKSFLVWRSDKHLSHLVCLDPLQLDWPLSSANLHLHTLSAASTCFLALGLELCHAASAFAAA